MVESAAEQRPVEKGPEDALSPPPPIVLQGLLNLQTLSQHHGHCCSIAELALGDQWQVFTRKD